MLRVDAGTSRLRGECAGVLSPEVNVTGGRLEATPSSGFRLLVQGGGDESPTWSKIWKVHVRVSYGRARQGIQCLSFYVKQTGHVGFAVGEFSGEVGRSVSAMPSDKCVHRVAFFPCLLHVSRLTLS